MHLAADDEGQEGSSRYTLRWIGYCLRCNPFLYDRGGYRAATISYLIIFLHLFIVLNSVHLFDVLILDWLIIARITPKFLYTLFPGTEGCTGYKEFGFNKMEQVKNFGGTVVGSLALAGIAYGVMKWFVW
jgi:hypothetical protein